MNNQNKNTKFNDLTEEQLNQLSDKEIVDKALGEYTEDINTHIKEINICKKNVIGAFILAIVLFFAIPPMFSLIPLAVSAFYLFGLYKLNKSIVWYVRSFKSTATIYKEIGFDIFVNPHIDRVSKIVNIGNLYK